MLVAWSWLATPLLSAVPVAHVLHVPLIDAWFESISGYTTTGLSVFTGGVDPDYGVYIPSVEELPWSVLWWRAVSQWLGGFGVVVLFYTIGRLGGLPAHLIGAAEGRYERLEPSIAHSIKALMSLYVVLTILGTALLYIAGMGPADALYHTMTGLATGGFSTHSSSIGFFDSVVVEAATIVVMLVGAFNFADMYAVLRGVPRRFSGEIPGLLAIVAVEVTLGAVLLYATGWAPAGPVREAVYDVVSAATGTGFGISDLSGAPDAYKMLLVLAMLVGGSALSTTGGIKVFRAIIITRSIAWAVAETVYGEKKVTIKRVGSYVVDQSLLQSVASVLVLFLASLLAGALALMLVTGASAADAFFEAQSALCTVGLSVGITGAEASAATKAILMVLMTLGRLEVIGFLYAAVAARKMLRETLLARRRGRRPRLERLRLPKPAPPVEGEVLYRA
ncbi:MAG: TrkH family potassium uptake protein [Crenarchaeota archaeon]|nr:TrkH family potassium uptake protein [Thermoproteota archaeon]